MVLLFCIIYVVSIPQVGRQESVYLHKYWTKLGHNSHPASPLVIFHTVTPVSLVHQLITSHLDRAQRFYSHVMRGQIQI